MHSGMMMGQSCWLRLTNGERCAQLQDIHLARRRTIVRSMGDKNGRRQGQQKEASRGRAGAEAGQTMGRSRDEQSWLAACVGSYCKRLYRLLLIRHTFPYTHTHILSHTLALFSGWGQSHLMKSAARSRSRRRRRIELWQTCGINYGFRQSARHQQREREQAPAGGKALTCQVLRLHLHIHTHSHSSSQARSSVTWQLLIESSSSMSPSRWWAAMMTLAFIACHWDIFQAFYLLALAASNVITTLTHTHTQTYTACSLFLAIIQKPFLAKRFARN